MKEKIMSQKYGFKKLAILALVIFSMNNLSYGSSPTSETPVTQSKVDLLIKAADLDRQAAKKQASDPNGASKLRTDAKEIRDQANKLK